MVSNSPRRQFKLLLRLLICLAFIPLHCFGYLLFGRPIRIAFEKELSDAVVSGDSSAWLHFAFGGTGNCMQRGVEYFSIAIYVHYGYSRQARPDQEGTTESFSIYSAYHIGPSLPHFRREFAAQILESNEAHSLLLKAGSWYRVPVPPRVLAVAFVVAPPAPEIGRPIPYQEVQHTFIVDLRNGGNRWFYFTGTEAKVSRAPIELKRCESAG